MANGYSKVVGIVHNQGIIQNSGISYDHYIITRLAEVKEENVVCGKPCKLDKVKASVMHQFFAPDKVKDLYNKEVYLGYTSGNNPQVNFIAVQNGQ